MLAGLPHSRLDFERSAAAAVDASAPASAEPYKRCLAALGTNGLGGNFGNVVRITVPIYT